MTWQITPEPVRAAVAGGVALTFDDGPNPENTPALLDYLAERHIRAVFAVVGERIQAPGGKGGEILRRIVAEGHVLCNHSTGFADMGTWPADAVRADMLANLEIIHQAVGAHVPVPFWRAPNGSWGVTCEVAVKLGMQPLDVVNHIGDWEEQDPSVLAERLRGVMKPGELVLCHDGPEDRAGTVAAVRQVVDERLADGWTFTLPVGA